MFNGWFPVINRVSSEENSFESAPENSGDEDQFVSPRRPHQSPTASPRALLRPDPPPINEVLEAASHRLRNTAQRQVRAAAAAAANMPNPAPPVVVFEDEDGVDEAGALKEACQNLAKYEWSDDDLLFYFNQIEIKMSAAGVKKNFTKFQVLSTIIPAKVMNQVKSLLRKGENEFPNKDAYKQLKQKILRIFGPRPEAAVERALSRVMTDKPSELARQLVNDICAKELDCECCPNIVFALWKRHLSSSVRAGIAHCSFNKDTFEDIIKRADDIHIANNLTGVPVMAAVAVPQASSLNETQPAIAYPIPEVAAAWRGGGRGRGGRGRGQNRGGRGGGGGQSQPGSQGQSGGQQNGGQTQSGGQSTRPRGAKHPDLPAGDQQWCRMHYRWGRGSHFCAAPATCPWKNVFTPKPQSQ